MVKIPTSATIPLPKVSLGKTKKRSQLFDIATLDGRVITKEIPALLNCVDEAKSGHAFLIDDANQYLNEDGVWIQVAGESSAVPMMTRKPRDMSQIAETIKKIFKDTKEDAKLAMFVNRGKQATLDKLLWLVGIPTTGFVLIAGLHFIKG